MPPTETHDLSAALFGADGARMPLAIGSAETHAAVRSIFEWLPDLDPERWDNAFARLAAGETDMLTSSAPTDAGDLPITLRVRGISLDGQVVALAERDNAAAGAAAALTVLQQRILADVATGKRLQVVMNRLCHDVEAMRPGVVASVLAVDPAGRLRHLASPSLPGHFCRAIDGLSIGPMVGSCGTAAFLGEPVEVTDIATDPRWAVAKELAAPLGLKACWSSPIKAGDGRVVGTFAFYFRECRGPDDADRRIVEACLALSAIAIEHEEAGNRVEELALRDYLTGLPNRLGFQRGAGDALEAVQRMGTGLALHFLDFDDFKVINDAFGHHVGDLLLKEVSARVAGCLRYGENIARLGGDEFAIIQRGATDDAAVEELAVRVLTAVAAPLEIGGHRLQITACLGAARSPRDGNDIAELLKNADIAVYRAKSEGHGRYRLFSDKMAEGIRAERLLERDLAEAIEQQRLDVHFQPIIDLAGGRIISFEALVRWTHPERGPIAPSEFVPIAERAGLVADLGDFVLRRACREAAGWPAEIGVSVNLSPSQLARPDFMLSVIRAVHEAGLSPSRLDLEITETVPLSENSAMRAMLEQLRSLGVTISLDDFGVGYSSLSYLRSFPFDRIKIDMSFVRDIGRRADAEAILKAAIGLGGALKMRTTAEGVETEAQRDWLVGQGCDEGQGYLFSRPVPAADAARLVSIGVRASQRA